MWYLPVAFVLCCAFFAYWRAFFSYRKHYNYRKLPIKNQKNEVHARIHTMIDDIERQSPSKTFTILSKDKKRLHARYYHIADGAPLHIQFHGYRSSGYRDFCGGTKLARELGYNTLVVDQRAHGKSGGRSITFGIREKEDCRAWAEFAAETFGRETPIFLSGVSMGAATVLMASELSINAKVVGIIADCPYSSPEEIIKKVCGQDMKLPIKIAYPFVVLGALMFGRFRIRGGAMQAVQNTNIPICIIHGQADTFVPCEMSRQIAESAKSKCELHIFEGAGHGLSFIVDEPRYRDIIEKFSKECLEGELK